MRSDSFTVQNTNSLKPLKTVSDWLLMGANMPTGRGSDAAIKRTFGRSFKFFFYYQIYLQTAQLFPTHTYIHTYTLQGIDQFHIQIVCTQKRNNSDNIILCRVSYNMTPGTLCGPFMSLFKTRMGRPTFHASFKTVASMFPIQRSPRTLSRHIVASWTEML